MMSENKSRTHIALTPDDERIFLEIYQNDIIDTDGLCALLSHRGDEGLRKRIRKLVQSGYIDELRQPLFRPGGGTYAKRYRLTNTGSRHLEDVCKRNNIDLPIPTTRWHTKNLELTPSFIRHQIEDTKFLCQLRGSVAQRDDIDFLFPHEIYANFAPEFLKRKTLPNTLRTKVDYMGHKDIEGTKPDRFFALRYRKNPEGKQFRFLFLETDMGNETINPTNRVIKTSAFWRGSSLLRKWVVYGQGFVQTAHKKCFGIPTFQVLHVTTNAKRSNEMIETFQHRLAVGAPRIAPNRFLFTDMQTVEKYGGDILQIPLKNGIGSTLRLGDNLGEQVS